MKTLKSAVKSHITRNSTTKSQRHSAVLDLKYLESPVIFEQALEKRPTVEMLPRESSSSLPLTQSTSHPRSPPPAVGALFLQRPTLSAILANKSPEPWTLEAFTEYCQQNLCIENLNFIMAAQQYQNEYEQWLSTCTVPPCPADIAESESLMETWNSIISQYIMPLSPQEVNIPGIVRDGITSTPQSDVPAEPSTLQPAVRKIMELMQDSIVFSFINDVRPEQVAGRQVDDMQGVEHSHRYNQHQQQPPHHRGGSIEDWQKSRSIQIDAPLSGSPPANSGFAYPQSSNSLFHKHSTGSTGSSHRQTSSSSYRSSRPKSVVSSREPLESSASPSMQSSEDISDIPSPRALSESKSTSPSLPPMRSVKSQERRSSPKSGGESGWKKFGAMMGLKKN